MSKTGGVLSRFSLARLLEASDTKAELLDEVVTILSGGLKELDICWNPAAFRKGILNPKIPKPIIARLEDFLEVCQELDWRLPETLRIELDELIEDIESFNPAFLKTLANNAFGPKVKR